MSVIQARPTFLLSTDLSESAIMLCIKDALSKHPHDYRGQFTSHHALICIEESKRHFWSPWLHLDIRADDDDDQGQHVFGRFSPNPAIWTGFMLSWLAIGVLIFFAIMFGISQQLTGLTPWAYVFVPVGFFVGFTLWLVAKTGQKLAHDEMQRMKSTVEECLRIKP